MKLKLHVHKPEDLKFEFERILDVLSVAINRGFYPSLLWELNKNNSERGYFWMYQLNQMPSTFEECDRVCLKPLANDHWVNIKEKVKLELIFEINFRYSDKEPEKLFSELLLWLFKNNLKKI